VNDPPPPAGDQAFPWAEGGTAGAGCGLFVCDAGAHDGPIVMPFVGFDPHPFRMGYSSCRAPSFFCKTFIFFELFGSCPCLSKKTVYNMNQEKKN
jgi:hypothetical protein